MRNFDYQRLIIGYHGCDARIRDAVIQHGASLVPSKNDYDWLGYGIYFWEHGPDRAWQWAELQCQRGLIRQPAAVGAVLHLGRCFDLLDSFHTNALAESFPEFHARIRKGHKRMPKNEPLHPDDADNVLRYLDCAVINWTIKRINLENPDSKIQSVRGVFQEGEDVFAGSAIRRWSHVQVAVLDPACIVGYFLPPS